MVTKGPGQDQTSIDRRRALALAGGLATSSALAGYLSEPALADEVNDGVANSDPELLETLVEENRRFAFDLYEEVTPTGTDENRFYSPHSISVALAMTFAGARGETRRQMAETMRYTLGDDVHAAIESLARELDERSGNDETDEDDDADEDSEDDTDGTDTSGNDAGEIGMGGDDADETGSDEDDSDDRGWGSNSFSYREYRSPRRKRLVNFWAELFDVSLDESSDERSRNTNEETPENSNEAENEPSGETNSRDSNETESDPANGEGSPDFALHVENALWGQSGYPFAESYLDLLESYYEAGLREVDFASDPEAARETINEWVETQTEERIEELLPEGSLTQLTRLVLTNAVYFQATWEHPFDEAHTEDAEFTALDGSTTEVPMMSQSSSTFPYAEVDGHQVIELPYVGEEVAMVVILPAEGEFESFEAELDADRFDELIDELEPQEGSISMPRFDFKSTFNLSQTLSEMGMPSAFEPSEADFTGITGGETEDSLHIDDVFHEANVTVDEEGTEAAAATAVSMGLTSAPLSPFDMDVNRPFIFAIRDRPTGAVLFLGRVTDAGDAQ